MPMALHTSMHLGEIVKKGMKGETNLLGVPGDAPGDAAAPDGAQAPLSGGPLPRPWVAAVAAVEVVGRVDAVGAPVVGGVGGRGHPVVGGLVATAKRQIVLAAAAAPQEQQHGDQNAQDCCKKGVQFRVQ